MKKMEGTLRMRNYMKFSLVKAIAKENGYKTPEIVKIYIYMFCWEILQRKVNFCDLTLLKMSIGPEHYNQWSETYLRPE